MRLILLTALTMIAFASNSILTRMAVGPGHIDAIAFAVIRVMAGAVFLCALAASRGATFGWRGQRRLVGALSLGTYMLGFSLAYIALDAGLGALILFGVVQISMFSYGAAVGQSPSPRQLVGAAVAFAGLILALWPDGARAGSIIGAAYMVMAGIGWAIYTLTGKSARDPLTETATNFALCLPLMILPALVLAENVTFYGAVLAVLCGAVTSGLGYALWYSVLPNLERTVAAIVQLSVPVIAIFAGIVFLGEKLTLSVSAATLLVVAGIALAVTQRQAPADHS